MAEIICVHCGDNCGKNPVYFEEKPFCCYGCKTVYQIIQENKLGRYYDILPTPGIKVDEITIDSKYAYLENADLRSKIIDFSDGSISRVTFFIPSIHCSSCIWLLEKLNRLQEGIIHSNVNFLKKELTLTFREDVISLRKLAELLHSLHYIPEITTDRLGSRKTDKTGRTLIIKIGIAGFAFANIMLFKMPEYLPGGNLLEGFLKEYFGALSFILTIPVVFYCSSDYYLSAVKNLRHGILNIDFPISLGIFIIFLHGFYYVMIGAGGGYTDSLAGLVFFLLIGKWYQNKTYQALSFERDYKSFFPIAVTRKKEMTEENIPLSDIQPGDKLIIRNLELIPADGILIKGTGKIDYSFVTGESSPVNKLPGDYLFAGGRQEGGIIEIEVMKPLEQSYLTQLWNQQQVMPEKQSNLKRIIDKVSNRFTIIILSLALSTLVFWLFNRPDMAIYCFTSVLIIACPCALALSMPFTFGSAMRVAGKNGFYLKRADVIENLSKTDHIVFDKTGTITYSSSMRAEYAGAGLSSEEKDLVRSVVRHSTHPLSLAIFEGLGNGSIYEAEEFEEIPSLGISGKVNGVSIKLGSHEYAGLEHAENPRFTLVYLMIRDKPSGYFRFENHYRDGLNDVVDRLSGIYKLHVLTGDNDSEKENLIEIFGKNASLHFNQKPVDKLNYVKALKQAGARVLMIGDGLNDAGALAESNTGISVAEDIHHFSPACDAILNSDQFKKLPDFLRLSRSGIRILKTSFIISYLYNIIGLTYAVQGLLSPLVAAILMPVSSVSVVAFTTLSVLFASKRIFKSQ